MSFATNARSIPELFADLVTQFSTLLRKEGQLARAEIAENIGKMTAGLSFIVGGAVLLIPALVILLQAAVALLVANGLAAHVSAAIVGGLVLMIGLVLLIIGWSQLKAKSMIPHRTIHQLREDVLVAKEQARQRHDLHPAA